MFDHHITMDSFGQECPVNWEEISGYLNDKIDAMSGITDEYGDITPEGREQVNMLWEKYWSGDLPEAPKPMD